MDVCYSHCVPTKCNTRDYHFLISLNPVTSIVESFRHIFLGNSSINFHLYLTSLSVTLLIFLLGLFSFLKLKKTLSILFEMKNVIEINNLYKEYKLGVIGRALFTETYKVSGQKL